MFGVLDTPPATVRLGHHTLPDTLPDDRGRRNAASFATAARRTGNREAAGPVCRLVAALLLLMPLTGVAADDGDPAMDAIAAMTRYHELLLTIDRSRSFETSDFSVTFTVVSEKPGDERSVIKARMFRRDAEEKFVLVYLEPIARRGQGYLQVGDNLWFYDPESRMFSHSSLRESLADSEARNSDLTQSSLAQDYIVDATAEGRLGRYDVRVLDLRARHDEVTFPRVKLWVRQDDNLILKAQNFSLSGRLVRSDYFPKYVRVEDRLLPAQVLLVDELKEGERTQMTMTMVDTSLARLPDSVFTKSYLERVNR